MDAPRGSVELEHTDELERLRRRAYGPDADIAGDAAAQARLSELEAAARGHQSAPAADAAARVPAVVPDHARVSDDAPVAEPPGPVEGLRPAATAAPQGAERPINDGAPAAPWWRRRRGRAILVGAFAALALIVALIAWMFASLAAERPSDTSTVRIPPVPAAQGRGIFEPAPDLVLAVKPSGADAPQDPHGVLDALGIRADELRHYEDFEGMEVWSGASRYGMACLFVTVPGQGFREGRGAEGCSPDGLDTQADLASIAGRGVTRFVLESDHVDVFVYNRAADPNTSQG